MSLSLKSKKIRVTCNSCKKIFRITKEGRLPASCPACRKLTSFTYLVEEPIVKTTKGKCPFCGGSAHKDFEICAGEMSFWEKTKKGVEL